MRAAAYFTAGYNCAQAVVLAFGDVTGWDEKSAAALSSAFGGGMGRMREVCGAVSGMLLVLGTVREGGAAFMTGRTHSLTISRTEGDGR